MRRFAPALGGPLTRRNIALSPHFWSAMGVMFAIYAVSDFVIAFAVPGFDRDLLLLLGVALGVTSLVIFATRPPEPGSIASHVALASTYLGTAAAVVAFAPHGSATVISALFTAPLLAVWLESRNAIAAHLVVASVALVAAAGFTGDSGTIFATACFVPATWVLTVICVVVLDAVEAQGREYDRLALRDALTGVGNERALLDALKTEFTRHRSAGDPLALVDLHLADFDALNVELGRAAGDGVLATVAAALTELAPAGATIARTAGDRFSILLPSTDAAGAEAFVSHVRRHLGRLSARAGAAIYPHDATRREALRTVAAERLAQDPGEGAAAAARAPFTRGLMLHPADAGPVLHVAAAGTPSPSAREHAWADTRVDRRGIARDPLVWRVTGTVVLAYALLAAATMVIAPDLATPATIGVTAIAALCGLVVLVVRPPAIETRLNHAVVAAVWLLPTGAMAACAPHASWAIGTTVFSGALIATRLTDRRAIVAHFLGFSGLLWALMLGRFVDAPSILAILTLLLSTGVLVACYTTVYEAAEAQGRQMLRLVLRDPVTGAGNERLLRERLADEFPRHRDMQMPLVLLELELDGLGAVRARDGRGAATFALRDVAALLASAAGPDATVSRVEGDRFRVLLPLTSADELGTLLRDIRRAISVTSRRGHPTLPRIGVAAFPDDGETDQQLIRVASERMAADDPRSHDLSEAPDPFDEPLPVRRIVPWPPTAEQYAERRRSAG